MNDTIFALSSGALPAAIAVVRVSGPQARAVLALLAGRMPPPRKLAMRMLGQGGETIDQALVVYFPAPATSTGEDVAEFHLHGGRAVAAALLAALGSIPGLRAAEPGEFTRRAFENGRIDLTAAEGLADLLAAETESQRRAAVELAGGALARLIEDWQQGLIEIAAAVEARLDFSDELDAPAPWERAPLHALSAEIEAMLQRPPVERLRDGIRAVFGGPPNTGKSSLFNALVRREAAIVAAAPGTTRDLIEAPVAIGGTPFVLVDSAGLRDTGETIEAIGVERAKSALERADLVLWLGDPGEAPSAGHVIRVAPKCDIDPAHGDADVAVSAHSGEGLERLERLLLARAAALLPVEGVVALHQRHRDALADALGWMKEAGRHDDLLVVGEALRQARTALDRVTGRAGVEAMLDALFERFCIGK
ncbi:MAG: tRNA uridine-5-carboxymethylaminomethyl(34) synthesis GTPase MnmE [Sphingosinicella sp.]